MAVAPVQATISADEAYVFAWAQGAAGDTGQPVRVGHLRQLTVQAIGTGTVTLQGSNDGTTFTALNDPQGDPISVTAGALARVQELPLYIRPSIATNPATVIVVGSR